MGKYVAMVFCIIQMVLVPFMAGCSKSEEPGIGPLKEAIIIDHNHTDLNAIPDAWISVARQELHIAYSHTSHGSQITDGMTGLAGFRGSKYACCIFMR